MRVLGLMSGSSAKGLDLALCEIEGAPPALKVSLLTGKTLPYPDSLRQMIRDAGKLETSNTRLISELNFQLARHIAHSIHFFLAESDFFSDIDLIASHGQTVWHEVNEQGQVTSTLQIGAASVIAEETGVTTISNFCQRDIAVGGQGAPLIAYADWLLLRHPTRWRAIQHISRLATVTILPPINDRQSRLLTFDTGAGNILIDAAVHLLTNGAEDYDKDGQMALASTVDLAWLDALLQHPYYVQAAPKTVGRGLFNADLAHDYVAQGQARGLSTESIIATLTALTAYSIYYAYDFFSPQPIEEVIIGGGGSNNPALLQELRALFDDVPVLIHEDIGFNSDYKEALALAVLAYETWHNRPSTLPEQTGARKASVLGDITPSDNYLNLIEKTWLAK